MAVQTDFDYYTDKYPFVSGLKEMGMYAQLISGKVNIGPADLVTQDIITIARENRESIYQELLELGLSAAEDHAETFQCVPPTDRFDDFAEAELELLSDEYVFAYELANEAYLGGNENPFWIGDMANLSDPSSEILADHKPELPFFWLHVMKLDNPALKNRQYRFHVMFRDTSGKDSIIIEQKLRDMLAKRKLERGY